MSLLLAAALAAGPVDRVLLRSGQVIAVSGQIRQADGKLLFRSPAGVLYSIAIEEVDFAAMAQTGPKEDPIEEMDRETRHPAKKLNVSPEERDRLLAQLEKKKGTSPGKAELLSPEPPEKEKPKPSKAPDPAAEERWRAEARAAREAVESRKRELEALKQRATTLEDQLRTLLSSGYDPSLLSAQALELDNTKNRIEATQEALRDAQ
ncbi:MAG TPA: hypothetical protein VFV54_00505, partial [Thermoanaerobaculia bacterium]|nr:hypothetical protein [Thermoanaerobaculia bacterium]